MEINQQIITSVIAATAALSGVLIAQAISILLSFLDKRHKKHILLRQKYEEMMFHFQDSLLYCSQVGTCTSLDQLLQQNHSVPAQRAAGLALLYFPTLAPIFDTYQKNLMSYYSLVISNFRQDVPATAGAQVRVHAKDDLEEIEKALFQSKDKIIAELKSKVKNYTKA